MSQLVLENVRKSYGSTDVIKGVDLTIDQGDFCVFVGPSGCGKSTLLRMISGLEPITSGDIKIGGEVVNDVPAADRGLAMVFQSYALYPHMSVRQNLTFGLENVQTPKAEITTKIAEVSKMLQIEELLERRPKDLSGGQRQRVAIGRAVVREPSIFLFDEPLSNLDAELRVDMRGEITALHGRLGNTMIYVTHDQVEAMTMADKIAVLRAGLVEQYGAPLDIYNNPANQFVAGFIGSPKMNFLTGKITDVSASGCTFKSDDGDTLVLPADKFDVSVGQDVTLGVRPNHLKVAEGDVHISVKVRSTEQLGGESFLYCRTASDTSVTVQLSGQTKVKQGTEVGFLADLSEVHLFAGNQGVSLKK